jgi:hypothetical protein
MCFLNLLFVHAILSVFWWSSTVLELVNALIHKFESKIGWTGFNSWSDQTRFFCDVEYTLSIWKFGLMYPLCFLWQVVEVSTSKTGKHGHAKCHFVGIDIFTGKKLEDIVPSSHNCDVCSNFICSSTLSIWWHFFSCFLTSSQY